MATFPDGVRVFREKENLPGVVFDPNNKKTLYADDMIALEEEVRAVEATLLMPAGRRMPIVGTGFPNGVVTAPVGAKYIDTNATNGAIEWIKKSGTGNTGWVVSIGDTGWRNLGQVWPEITENILLRRIGDICYVTSQGEALTIASTTSNSQRFMELGFKPSGRTELLIAAKGVIRGRILAKEYEESLFLSTNTTGTYNAIANNSYLTTNAWPSTLPGTAV